jgi:peptidoglycan hydrolase-like protein with peptidoglycan-binding domain
MRGVAGLAIEAVQENPSIAAGICTFAVAFSLVAGNALYGQRGGHPVPLFATRDAITTRSVEKPVARETRKQADVPAVEGAAKQVPVPQSRPEKAAVGSPSSSLVRDTQEGLKLLGHYAGEVDGLYGPKTREAIVRFERAAGLEATGLVSAALAEMVTKGTKKQSKPAAAAVVEAAPVVPVEKVAADPARPAEAQKAVATGSSAKAEPASLEPVKVETVRIEAPEAAAAPADTQTSAETAADVRLSALVARIQIGLQNFGELEVPLDGQLGARTVDAIRRFQDRYGLAADGQPSEALVDKLEQIGALRKS